jgi:hypothetical protein
MQFIEVSSFGMRSAIYTVRKHDEPLEFVLFPMVHIGEVGFYEDIARRLSECDAILVEGVPSAKVSALALSYRLLAKRKDWNLVTQHSLDLSAFRDKIVRTDIDEGMFNAGWSNLPLMTKLNVILLFPLIAVYLFLFSSKKEIASYLELNDLPSRMEVLTMDDSTWEGFDSLVLHKRDQVFLRKLEEYYKENRNSGFRVGILYGAGHMRAIFGFLSRRLGYRVAEAEWVSVFYL